MIRFAFAILLAATMASDPRPKGASLHPWPEDVPRKLELETTGIVRSTANVVAWLPAGALSDDAMREIVSRLDRGIGAAKKAIGKPAWAFEGDPRVFFYFPDARFVAHAPGGNTAFAPLWRIRDDEAPWLHESLHLLLSTPGGDWLARDDADARMPLWFTEGLADALAIQISESEVDERESGGDEEGEARPERAEEAADGRPAMSPTPNAGRGSGASGHGSRRGPSGPICYVRGRSRE
jgi:hypothetical protein